ncbi:unnamed protein product [Peniophora sp. CBMAI 1063]|nr:unnamed protein product [Peniophora sp. CBMAI 1063]
MAVTIHLRSVFGVLPSKFNVARACIFILVILWSLVCLAIAAHFESVLASSDLTRFVPFALFVSVASILVMSTLFVFGIWRNMNPIATRIELSCLGLIGTFWLALGAFLVSSDSETADVECFVSEDNATPLDDDSFSTETYQAQYHVLEAFALFNAILLWGFLIFLTILAVRRHRAGDKYVWLTPVPNVAWFGASDKPQGNGKGGKNGKLPAPVTAKNEKSSSSRPRAPSRPVPAAPALARPEMSRPSYNRALDEHYVWIPADSDKFTSLPARKNGGTGANISRDNTRSTTATRYATAPPTRNNTRSTQATRFNPDDERDARPSRSNTRSTQATRVEHSTSGGPSRSNTRSTQGTRVEKTYESDRERPSRSNTRSTQATFRTASSRDGPRKPDYYRRDLSPRR